MMSMRPSSKRMIVWAGTLAILGGVFVMYLQPEAIVSLANQVWNCF